MNPDATSLRTLHDPGFLYDFRRRVYGRVFPNKSPKVRAECNESQGLLGQVLRSLPPGSIVIYQYMYPKIDDSLPIQRLLFQDMTVRDAVETASYGHAGLSESDVADKIAKQSRALAKTDGVITFSTYAADSISNEYDFPREKIVAIGAGPVRAPRSVSFATERYAAGKLLFVGRQWERKGGPLLLEAFRKVRQTVPHATLTIAGAAISPPNQDGVSYLGHVSNKRIAQLFAESSIFSMPAQCETWGLVYTEAAAAGLPIVGFNAWAMPDLVVNGVSGLLVDERTADQLANALIELLQQPSRMCEMGKAAHARMHDVLDWPFVADRLLAKFIPEALGDRVPVWMS